MQTYSQLRTLKKGCPKLLKMVDKHILQQKMKSTGEHNKLSFINQSTLTKLSDVSTVENSTIVPGIRTKISPRVSSEIYRAAKGQSQLYRNNLPKIVEIDKSIKVPLGQKFMHVPNLNKTHAANSSLQRQAEEQKNTNETI